MTPVQTADLIRMSALDTLPIWLLYIMAVILLMLAAEGGYRLSRYMQLHSPDQAQSVVGSLNGATLALLAFLLAFVVSIALNQFSARRTALVAEANAIGTAYLRAGTLPEPYQQNSRDLLREYTDVRISAMDVEKVAQAIVQSEEIHRELWADIAALTLVRDTPSQALYEGAVNAIIDLHTERINYGLVARLPASIVLGLFVIALIALGLVGLHAGYVEKRNLFALFALVLILSVIFALIVDLGRSQGGLLKVSYQALFDLQRSMNMGQ